MAPQQSESKTDPDVNVHKKYSLARKLLRTNSVGTEFIIPLFDEFKESRPFILTPMYSTPTSLPLYFFFGYQLLQEKSDLMKICGPVSDSLLLLKCVWNLNYLSPLFSILVFTKRCVSLYAMDLKYCIYRNIKMFIVKKIL